MAICTNLAGSNLDYNSSWFELIQELPKVLGDAVEDLYDKALIISADSDLLPVIKSVQKHAPEKDIGIMFPIGYNSFELRQTAAFHLKMSDSLLRDCQFLDKVNVGGTIIERPKTWQ